MAVTESVALSTIKVARKYFRNTWVHRLPFTSWVFRQVFSLTYAEPEKEIEFRGKKFLVYTKDTCMVPSIINQDYETFELDIFEQIVKPGMTVLDIGANLGIYAVTGSKAAKSSGRLYAFEPVPENLTLLKHNLKLNKSKNTTVVPQAVGAKSGRVNLYLANENTGTHSMREFSDTTMEVQVTTIDDFVQSKNISVDVIKMDIEGYEGHALRGGIKTLKKMKKIKLLTEFNATMIEECGDSPRAVVKLLLDLFKYCYVIDERKECIEQVSEVGAICKLVNSNLLLSNTPVKLN